MLLFLVCAWQLVLAQLETMWCLPMFLAHVYMHALTEPNWEASIPCQQNPVGIAVSITSAFVVLFVKSTASSKTVDSTLLRYVQIQLPPFTTITMNNPSSFIHYFNFFRSFFLVIKVGQSVLRKWKAEPQHLRFLHQACRGGGMYKGGGPLAPSKFWNFFKYIYNYFNIFKF